MICNQRKDINLGTDYTVTGVQRCRGEAFVPWVIPSNGGGRSYGGTGI